MNSEFPKWQTTGLGSSRETPPLDLAMDEVTALPNGSCPCLADTIKVVATPRFQNPEQPRIIVVYRRCFTTVDLRILGI